MKLMRNEKFSGINLNCKTHKGGPAIIFERICQKKSSRSLAIILNPSLRTLNAKLKDLKYDRKNLAA